MLVPRPTCPRCGSQHTAKNGIIHNKKQKYQCQDCKRQFVENPLKKVIDQETIELINRLLLEKIPLAGIDERYSSIENLVTKIRQCQI